jgi:hypothetical protein
MTRTPFYLLVPLALGLAACGDREPGPLADPATPSAAETDPSPMPATTRAASQPPATAPAELPDSVRETIEIRTPSP